MALAEVMVSTGVLLLMLGLATMALLTYLRGTRQLLSEPMATEAVARGLERCARLLRSAQAVAEPSREALLAGYQPQAPDRAPLVLRLRTPQGFRWTGLSWDPERQCLVELLYADAYDRQQPYPASARRLELGPARGVTFQLTRAGQLRVVLAAGPQQLPWSTAVTATGWAWP